MGDAEKLGVAVTNLLENAIKFNLDSGRVEVGVSGTADPAGVSADNIDEQKLVTINSPIVGIFYSAQSPESPPFVTVGSRVTKGQVLCIVEAMKLMNEIECETDGQIVKVLVENGQPVEYGEPLFLVEPL